MMRVKCTIGYDGTRFNGFQIQPNMRTVQGEVERGLKRLHKGKEVKVFASGRTDAGVHAVGQVLHFDTDIYIPEDRWPNALNSLLAEDVAIQSVSFVNDDFHARYHVRAKEYRYKISRSAIRNVFNRNYSYHYPYKLDYVKMREAIKFLIGTHDFTSFCSAKTDKEDRVRTLYDIEFYEEDDMLTFRFVGDGFLYNMVRILVGTLINAGRGALDPYQIPEILKARDRSLCGKTAPGCGLYLWKVYYDN
ncbi:tRNA pseudouridine(38-40) synthase TruA [Bacillus sp. V2I10]|uniref:tRNA pseudouridine(38-40) synthase TruA n=1 Tax=Bacillus sp. V2I10 TaxID=3042276 RepID=UPI0027D929B8|nr:tRNA pseudouridine(38-40) synthase TruA [Bacillus sp. V2I10]